ncbi:MAG TPA: hypothetical protein VFE14_15290 [Micromonosporaceae bacterium]|nr:hypothetical protein [Micromonosporaceae bacterium]
MATWYAVTKTRNTRSSAYARGRNDGPSVPPRPVCNAGPFASSLTGPARTSARNVAAPARLR